MTILTVERIGGLAGFGGPHLRSDGTVNLAELAPQDLAVTERLFAGNSGPAVGGTADGFRYRLTRPDGKVVEVAESEVPQALRDSVRDRLA